MTEITIWRPGQESNPSSSSDEARYSQEEQELLINSINTTLNNSKYYFDFNWFLWVIENASHDNRVLPVLATFRIEVESIFNEQQYDFLQWLIDKGNN